MLTRSLVFFLFLSLLFFHRFALFLPSHFLFFFLSCFLCSFSISLFFLFLLLSLLISIIIFFLWLFLFWFFLFRFRLLFLSCWSSTLSLAICAKNLLHSLRCVNSHCCSLENFLQKYICVLTLLASDNLDGSNIDFFLYTHLSKIKYFLKNEYFLVLILN